MDDHRRPAPRPPIDALNCCVAILDESGSVVEVNVAWREALGSFGDAEPPERRYQARLTRLSIDGRRRAVLALDPVDGRGRDGLIAEARATFESGRPLPEIFRETTEAMVRHLGAALARIWTLDRTGLVLKARARSGPCGPPGDADRRVLVGRRRVGRIAAESLPFLSNDLADDRGLGDPDWIAREGIVAFAGVPVIVRGGTVGVLAIYSRSPLSIDTVEAMEDLASTAARAIERQNNADALRESEQRFRLLLEHAPYAFYLIDRDARILDVNRRSCENVGYTREALLSMGVEDIEVHLSRETIIGQIREAEPGAMTEVEGIHRRRDGSEFPVEVRSTAIIAGGERFVIALVNDVTDRVRAAEALKHQALHDALTGLPNRALLVERLERAIDRARSEGAPLALMLLDLDRFKEINDTLGHHCGDRVLKALGPRLRRAVRDRDLVARLGGDEFAVLLPEATCDEALAVATRIGSAIREPIEVGSRRVEVGDSIGIALFPEHGEDADALLRAADVAMYRSKRSRSGRPVVCDGPARSDPQRLSLAADLRRGIDAGELLLHYQPKVDLATGVVRDVEALIRWQHPEDGLIQPSTFIPLAEQTGLIRPLGLWAVREAVRQATQWKACGIDLRISVNLDAQNLQDPELRDALAALFEDPRVDPGRLAVEVTERCMMAEPDRVVAMLKWLHDAGSSISIDDFGTGHSSLSDLKLLPVDEVKIDRALVRDIAVDPEDAHITRAVIDLGHKLGLRVVAEGVEGDDARRLLASWGCDQAQGFAIGPPLPPAEFIAWLDREQPAPLPEPSIDLRRRALRARFA